MTSTCRTIASSPKSSLSSQTFLLEYNEITASVGNTAPQTDVFHFRVVDSNSVVQFDPSSPELEPTDSLLDTPIGSGSFLSTRMRYDVFTLCFGKSNLLPVSTVPVSNAVLSVCMLDQTLARQGNCKPGAPSNDGSPRQGFKPFTLSLTIASEYVDSDTINAMIVDKCSWFDEHLWRWSASGCRTERIEQHPNAFYCHCDHLTEFTILRHLLSLDGSQPEPVLADRTNLHFILPIALYFITEIAATFIFFKGDKVLSNGNAKARSTFRGLSALIVSSAALKGMAWASTLFSPLYIASIFLALSMVFFKFWIFTFVITRVVMVPLIIMRKLHHSAVKEMRARSCIIAANALLNLALLVILSYLVWSVVSREGDKSALDSWFGILGHMLATFSMIISVVYANVAFSFFTTIRGTEYDSIAMFLVNLVLGMSSSVFIQGAIYLAMNLPVLQIDDKLIPWMNIMFHVFEALQIWLALFYQWHCITASIRSQKQNSLKNAALHAGAHKAVIDVVQANYGNVEEMRGRQQDLTRIAFVISSPEDVANDDAVYPPQEYDSKTSYETTKSNVEKRSNRDGEHLLVSSLAFSIGR